MEILAFHYLSSTQVNWFFRNSYWFVLHLIPMESHLFLCKLDSIQIETFHWWCKHPCAVLLYLRRRGESINQTNRNHPTENTTKQKYVSESLLAKTNVQNISQSNRMYKRWRGYMCIEHSHCKHCRATLRLLNGFHILCPLVQWARFMGLTFPFSASLSSHSWG